MQTQVNLRTVYERTTCSCPSCRTCCIYKPGMLSPYDMQMYWDKFPDMDASKFFEASEGAVVVVQGAVHRIPTIVPRLMDAPQGCVFRHQETGLCTIHEDAPYGCGWFDVHMSEEESTERARAVLIEIAKDFNMSGIYSLTWIALKHSGCVAAPLKDRQGRLQEALNRVEGGRGPCPKMQPQQSSLELVRDAGIPLGLGATRSDEPPSATGAMSDTSATLPP